MEELIEIPLTLGYVTKIDASDLDLISQYTWRAFKSYNLVYAVYGSIRMHRLIMNAKKGEEVDHIDGNGLNNKRSNLRICSHNQNMWNVKKQINCVSKYKGVHPHSTSKKWAVQICVKGERINLGLYYDEVDAAMIYDQAARKHFGEYAKLNFPDEYLDPNKEFKGNKKHPTTGYKRIYFDEGRNAYRTYILANGIRTLIGQFKTLDEAIQMQQEAYARLAQDDIAS